MWLTSQTKPKGLAGEVKERAAELLLMEVRARRHFSTIWQAIHPLPEGYKAFISSDRKPFESQLYEFPVLQLRAETPPEMTQVPITPWELPSVEQVLKTLAQWILYRERAANRVGRKATQQIDEGDLELANLEARYKRQRRAARAKPPEVP